MTDTSLQRIYGIDVARALALIGMMAAHFGASKNFGASFWDSVGAVTHGRSAILFAVLAGVSIALVTGRTTPVAGETLVQARMKLVLRALFILFIGSGLAAYGSGIDVILPTYALLFVIAVFFLRARRRTLVWWAVGCATIGSALSVVLTPLVYNSTLPIPFPWMIASDNYKLLPWISLVLAGMALGRTDLTSLSNILKIGGLGVLLAVVAYGSTVQVPFADSSYPAVDREFGLVWQDGQYVDMTEVSYWGQVRGGFAGFDQADPHSGTPAEILGGIGVAMVVIALCLLVTRRFAFVFYPLTAFGSMPLTIYTVHVLTFKPLWNWGESFQLKYFLLSVVIGAVFAMLWKLRFKRGPIEAVMYIAITKFLTSPQEKNHS